MFVCVSVRVHICVSVPEETNVSAQIRRKGGKKGKIRMRVT